MIKTSESVFTIAEKHSLRLNISFADQLIILDIANFSNNQNHTKTKTNFNKEVKSKLEQN